MTLIASHRKEIPKSSWIWNVDSKELSLGLTFLNLFDEDADHVPLSFKEDVLKAFCSAELSEDIPFYRKTEHKINDKLYFVEWVGEATGRNEDGGISMMAGYAELGSSQDDFNLSVNEEALFFTRLMDNIRESIYFKDLESRFLKVNKACATKFGFDDPEKVIGKSDFDFFDDEHASPAFEDEQIIIKTEKPIYNKVEKEVFTNGKIEWASTSKMPLYNEHGVLIGTYGITRDVTAQKQFEQRLEVRNDLFSKLSEHSPGFLYLHKVDVNQQVSFPFVSEGITEVLELQPEDLKKGFGALIKLVHKDDIGRVLKSILWSVSTQQEWNCEYRVILPRKGLRWVRGKANPEIQEDGSVISSGFLSDITKEKSISELNRQLRKQFESVLDNVPNLIFVKDLDGKYIMANKAAREYFRLQEDEIIGKTDMELGIDKELSEGYKESDRNVIETGEALFVPEDESINPAGERVFHQTIKVPFQQTGTDEPAVLAVVTDITQRKRKELELNETLDIVGEQNKRLLNFAHIVSHNLRNHAGNISMLISLFDVEESEEEKEELMGYLKTASERLNVSIEDLNEIIDKQYKTKGDLNELKPAEMITKVKEILLSEILSFNIKFEEELDDKLTIEYNPAYLESIILNLLSNAIKYRDPQKKPKIKIELYKENEHTFLNVIDNGLGIDLQKHGDKLFGMYKTFHGNENSKGIGLFITKNQVESMGGSINVESEPGKGTTFKIKLT